MPGRATSRVSITRVFKVDATPNGLDRGRLHDGPVDVGFAAIVKVVKGAAQRVYLYWNDLSDPNSWIVSSSVNHPGRTPFRVGTRLSALGIVQAMYDQDYANDTPSPEYHVSSASLSRLQLQRLRGAILTDGLVSQPYHF
jgi:hypothetical protein